MAKSNKPKADNIHPIVSVQYLRKPLFSVSPQEGRSREPVSGFVIKMLLCFFVVFTDQVCVFLSSAEPNEEH